MQQTKYYSISILAVLADRDQAGQGSQGRHPVFQSSRSLRTATMKAFPQLQSLSNFNPRGPCGPRPRIGHEEGPPTEFQSSRSLRTATPDGDALRLEGQISILAVLADRDDYDQQSTGQKLHFNPRGPCGPRQQRRTKDLPRLCTKRRIFSPHQKVFCGKDGKTNVFPPLPRAFSGANLPGSVRALGPRTRSSGSLPAGRSACSQSARSCSRISFPGSKNADYPAPDP